MRSAILIDVETTGLIKPDGKLRHQPYITEIFCLKVDEDLNELDSFSTLVKPKISIPDEVVRLTGITDEIVDDAPAFSSIYRKLSEFFLGTSILVAHNCPFDREMLEIELRRMESLTKFPWPMLHICTADRSTGILGRRMGLADLYQYVTGKEIKGHHRAEHDVRALLECFRWMCEEGLIA